MNNGMKKVLKKIRLTFFVMALLMGCNNNNNSKGNTNSLPSNTDHFLGTWRPCSSYHNKNNDVEIVKEGDVYVFDYSHIYEKKSNNLLANIYTNRLLYYSNRNGRLYFSGEDLFSSWLCRVGK